MSTTTPQNVISLEYAPPQPDGLVLRVWRRVRTPLAIFFAGVLGALAGLWLTPQTYRASWVYTERSSSGVTAAGIERDVAARAAEFRSPAVLDAVQADLALGPTPLPAGEAGRDLLRQGLTVKPIPQSRLILITFRSRDMTLAPNVVRAYQQRMTGPGPAPAPLPTRGLVSVSSYRNPVGIVIGYCVGMFIAGVLFFRHRRRPRLTR